MLFKKFITDAKNLDRIAAPIQQLLSSSLYHVLLDLSSTYILDLSKSSLDKAERAAWLNGYHQALRDTFFFPDLYMTKKGEVKENMKPTFTPDLQNLFKDLDMSEEEKQIFLTKLNK